MLLRYLYKISLYNDSKKSEGNTALYLAFVVKKKKNHPTLKVITFLKIKQLSIKKGFKCIQLAGNFFKARDYFYRVAFVLFFGRDAYPHIFKGCVIKSASPSPPPTLRVTLTFHGQENNSFLDCRVYSM